MEISPEVAFFVGLAATVLAAIFRLLGARWGITLSKFWMTIIVAIFSMVIAVVANLPELPVYQDPLQYLGAWASLLSVYIGMATAIYNLLLSQLMDKLNLTVERFAASRR